MTAISPKPPSPGAPITEWDEAAVNTYLVSLGLGGYENVIYEHGITGDVLCALDNETLVDLGITSLGHRLNVLRAVYELKKEQGVAMGEDDWRPQEEVALEAMETAMTIGRMWDLLVSQHKRIEHLESESHHMRRALEERGMLPPSTTVPTLVEEGVAGGSNTPVTATSLSFTSPSQILNTSGGPSTSASATAAAAGPGGLLTPKPPLWRNGSGTDVRQPAASHATRPPGGTASGPMPSSPIRPEPVAPHQTTNDRSARSKEQAKSFRVNMEDPCWKVLPAALKKYKINDDWKMYALFICFGNTERCLSYDEKPLLLFQRLKESGQRPVFMLRHIRDIRSPVLVAQEKRAAKLGLPLNSSANVLPTIESTLTSPTKASNGVSAANGERPAGRTPGEGAFPELPSPGIREGHDSEGNVKPSSPQPNGTIVDRDGNTHKVTYAISIYPYIADRTDEFDVAVGATFVVMSKAKGWWFVQKDPEGRGNIVSDPKRSAWVPAGCLLELTSPVGSVTPSTPGRVPGLAPISPSNIISSSYPGKALMEFTSKDDNELSLKEGDRIRVYKKYCHWSYSIKEDTGARGWVPAWFVGKLPNEAGVQTSNTATPSPKGPPGADGSPPAHEDK